MDDLEQYQGISGSTAREIAASAERAIREGGMRSGESLPTVRRLAKALGTSPATVNSAYRILRQRGLVIAQGRRGTRVAPRPALRSPAAAPRSERSIQASAGLRDLTIGLADPELLPPLGPVLERLDLGPRLRLDRLETADPDLLAFARDWFGTDVVAAGAIAVVSGALDGIERVLQAHLRPGDRVLTEDPAYPPIRDILLALGLVAVPVAIDSRGFTPAALDAALRKGAEAILAVPRAQNPTGAALDDDRAVDLRGVLARFPDVLVVEDDHASAVSGAPFCTLIEPSRPRWAVVRSMSKILHPDMRLALVAGDDATIARVEGRQALGPRWVSHVLQGLVAEMLGDPQFTPISERAAQAYAHRREMLIGALADQGIVAHGRSGMNVWVPVREEAPVVRAVLDAGWVVLGGERFRLASSPGIRITISTLNEDEAAELARIIAGVEHAGTPRRMY